MPHPRPWPLTQEEADVALHNIEGLRVILRGATLTSPGRDYTLEDVYSNMLTRIEMDIRRLSGEDYAAILEGSRHQRIKDAETRTPNEHRTR